MKKNEVYNDRYKTIKKFRNLYVMYDMLKNLYVWGKYIAVSEKSLMMKIKLDEEYKKNKKEDMN